MIGRVVSTLLTFTAAVGASAQDSLPAELPCDTTMAFGHVYGATEIHSPIEMMTLNSVLVEPKPAFEPFDYIEIGVSAKSRRVWSASGSASFEDADSARAFMAALLERIEAAIEVSEKVGDEDSVMLFSDRVRIELAYRERAVYEEAIDPDRVELECNDIEMEEAAFAEALGRE